DRPDIAVLAVEARLEQPGLACERLLEVGQRLGELVVWEHRREPLAHQLFAAVARDNLGGVVERGEAAVGVEGCDRVGRRLEQVAVARLRAGEGLLRPLLLGDVAQRRDRAEQLPLEHQRRGGHGDDAFLTVRPHDLGFVVLLLAFERTALARGHVLTLGRRDDVVDRRAGKVIERAAEQHGRRAVGGEHAAVDAGHDHGVGEGGHDLRGHPRWVERRALRGCLGRWRRGTEPPGRRSAPALTHESYDATMAPFIKPRLLTAASVTACGVSPRLTQFLTISSAWIGCSSSYLACSSSHHRPRGPIFSFLARPRSAFSAIFCATPSAPTISPPAARETKGARAMADSGRLASLSPSTRQAWMAPEE